MYACLLFLVLPQCNLFLKTSQTQVKMTRKMARDESQWPQLWLVCNLSQRGQRLGTLSKEVTRHIPDNRDDIDNKWLFPSSVVQETPFIPAFFGGGGMELISIKCRSPCYWTILNNNNNNDPFPYHKLQLVPPLLFLVLKLDYCNKLMFFIFIVVPSTHGDSREVRHSFLLHCDWDWGKYLSVNEGDFPRQDQPKPS